MKTTPDSTRLLLLADAKIGKQAWPDNTENADALLRERGQAYRHGRSPQPLRILEFGRPGR